MQQQQAAGESSCLLQEHRRGGSVLQLGVLRWQGERERESEGRTMRARVRVCMRVCVEHSAELSLVYACVPGEEDPGADAVAD